MPRHGKSPRNEQITALFRLAGGEVGNNHDLISAIKNAPRDHKEKNSGLKEGELRKGWEKQLREKR